MGQNVKNAISQQQQAISTTPEEQAQDQHSSQQEPSRAVSVSPQSYSAILSTFSSSLVSSLKWCPTSPEQLELLETELLSVLKRPFKTYFVDIRDGWGQTSNQIQTLEMPSSTDTDTNSQETTMQPSKRPLVLVHGFAAGIGMWILNLDFLSENLGRKIYAFDLIGFGRSTRAPFDLSGNVEEQFVDSFERWRKEVGIDKFVMLGHSFGGYLSSCYAFKYPNQVSHLILADPWGVQDRNLTPKRGVHRFPFWVRAVNTVFQRFNPLAVLRATGPYGPQLVQKFRSDLREKFRPVLDDECHKFVNYVYHCNAQTATGESAFKSLTLPYGWPKNPLVHRLLDLDKRIGMTFIYGSRSWIEKAPGEFLRDCLTPGRVTVHVIQGSGHHVYADKYTEFNELVLKTCKNLSD